MTRLAQNDGLQAWPPRRVLSWAPMVLGLAIVVQHWVAHAGASPLPISLGWQDIFVGYPTGGLLLLGGLILIDPRPGI